MERIDIKPRLSDLAPFYGGVDYFLRTAYYDIEGKPTIIKRIIRNTLVSCQIAYNGFILGELYNLIEGRPTVTQRLLENIF